MLKTILPMPPQKRRMRPQRNPPRRNRLARLVDDRLDTRWIIHLTRNHNVEIIRKPDQPAIKHPMRRAGKRDAILHAVRPAKLDRLDMRGLRFSAPTAIDELHHGIDLPKYEA